MKRHPIVVDLDETLVLSDTLYESFIHLIRISPFKFLRLVFLSIFKSRSEFKYILVNAIKLNPVDLPYNKDLISYLIEQKDIHNRKIILASASNENFVKSVASYLNIFDDFFGSTKDENLKGENKAKKLVNEYGEKGFIYAGDSKSDIPVWLKASGAITIGNSKKYLNNIDTDHIANFPKKNTFKLLLKELRLYQWIKNILVFVPLLAAGLLTDFKLVLYAAVCFFSFSLAASSAYILNDMLDIDSDRKHPRKCSRPFASGDLPLQYGFVVAPLLLILSIFFASLINIQLSMAIIIYYILTSFYTFFLKTQPIVDVFTLAALYTLRVLAGGVATNIHPSIWLLSFSGCLFMSLAFLKRYAETDALNNSELSSSRRGYNKDETQIQMIMGVASGFSAIIVFSIWLESTAFSQTYSNQLLVWMVLPLLLLWQCRMWLSAKRGYMHDDPIVYTSKDKVSWGIFCLCGLLYTLGLYA